MQKKPIAYEANFFKKNLCTLSSSSVTKTLEMGKTSVRLVMVLVISKF